MPKSVDPKYKITFNSKERELIDYLSKIHNPNTIASKININDLNLLASIYKKMFALRDLHEYER